MEDCVTFKQSTKKIFWDILFHKDYYASAKDDLLKDKEALAELEAEGKNV